MYALTFAHLVRPVHLHCIVGTFFFSIFYFLCAHKKHKNANKRISDFFPLRCSLSVLSIFVRLQCFVLQLGCFCAFCAVCSFSGFCAFCTFGAFGAFHKKNNKELKTALITSFILLLASIVRYSHCGFKYRKKQRMGCFHKDSNIAIFGKNCYCTKNNVFY